mmetsp:Transcript_25956/g.56996  ORF Transcript_25956/g.56996 Transcript_25956/m.56996 type:complete len:791 (+) Transcript_25956:70-2442(+)
MPWLSEAFQGVSKRGGDLKDKVREHARTIVVKAQQLEEAAVNNLHRQPTLTAREEEGKLEWEARKLEQLRLAQATEMVQQWLDQMQGFSKRYADVAASSPASSSGSREPRVLTFLQIFLRSRALELALDSVARAPELRIALCSRALPPPDDWPENLPIDAAFARSFTAMLKLTIGPSGVWMPALGVLLASEGVRSDEQCRTWIVSLIGTQRMGWETASVLAQELDVKVAEEEAVSHSISNEQARPESPIRPGERLKAFLDYVHVQGASADLACHALALRSTLASDLATAAKHEEDLCQARASASAAVAAAATEVASTCSTEPELPSQDTGTVVQKEELRSKIDKLDPAMREIQREIEDAEQTQKELLQQVGILSEKLEVLRQRLSEKQKVKAQLETTFHRAAEDEQCRKTAVGEANERAEQQRAMALTVANLATGQLSNPALREDEGSHASWLQEKASGCKKAAMTSAIAVAEAEIRRTHVLAQLVQYCTEAMSPGEDVEPGTKTRIDAEIVRAARRVMSEWGQTEGKADMLVRELGKVTDEAEKQKAQALSESLQQAHVQCSAWKDKLQAALAKLRPSMEDLETPPSLPGEHPDYTAVSKGLRSLWGRLGPQPTSYPSEASSSSTQDLDPFLLSGVPPEIKGPPTPLTTAAPETNLATASKPTQSEASPQSQLPVISAVDFLGLAEKSASQPSSPAAEQPSTTSHEPPQEVVTSCNPQDAPQQPASPVAAPEKEEEEQISQQQSSREEEQDVHIDGSDVATGPPTALPSVAAVPASPSPGADPAADEAE